MAELVGGAAGVGGSGVSVGWGGVGRVCQRIPYVVFIYAKRLYLTIIKRTYLLFIYAERSCLMVVGVVGSPAECVKSLTLTG